LFCCVEVIAVGPRAGSYSHCDGIPEVGATYLCPLEDGRFGVCRVVRRVYDMDDSLYGEPFVLVAASDWVGDAMPQDMGAGEFRSPLHEKASSDPSCSAGPVMGCFQKAPPATFKHLGSITPSEEETALDPPSCLRDWNQIPEKILMCVWQAEDESERMDDPNRQ